MATGGWQAHLTRKRHRTSNRQFPAERGCHAAMSVICSDSDDSSDQDPVALQCTAFLSGMRCYKPCYLPSLPVLPNSYTKLRPLPTGSSTPTELKTVEPTAAYILSSCEHLKSMGTKDGRVLSEQSKATSSPVAGQLPTSPNLGHVNIKAATDGDNEGNPNAN
jgi:hypothetical protein